MTIWLDRDLKDQVQARARDKGETMTAVVTRGFRRYVAAPRTNRGV